ncbi:hypothetical protein J6590_098176, partial [Homalodisca vitripennis]
TNSEIVALGLHTDMCGLTVTEPSPHRQSADSRVGHGFSDLFCDSVKYKTERMKKDMYAQLYQQKISPLFHYPIALRGHILRSTHVISAKFSWHVQRSWVCYVCCR